MMEPFCVNSYPLEKHCKQLETEVLRNSQTISLSNCVLGTWYPIRSPLIIRTLKKTATNKKILEDL